MFECSMLYVLVLYVLTVVLAVVVVLVCFIFICIFVHNNKLKNKNSVVKNKHKIFTKVY